MDIIIVTILLLSSYRFCLVVLVWTPPDVERGIRFCLLVGSRFIIGHCHVRAFARPWHTKECVVCPWCGGVFTLENVLLECRKLSHRRRDLFRGIGANRGRSLEWLVAFMALGLGSYCE